MRIRLHDIPAEVDAYAADLRECFDVVEESDDYRDRGVSAMVRRYVDIRRRTTDAQGQAIAGVLAEVAAERRRQLDKWGVQHRPDGTGGSGAADEAEAMQRWCQHAARNGGADWRLVLLEEVYEALAETDPAALRAELVQVAAVAAAWVEDIDHRAAEAAHDDGNPAPDLGCPVVTDSRGADDFGSFAGRFTGPVVYCVDEIAAIHDAGKARRG